MTPSLPERIVIASLTSKQDTFAECVAPGAPGAWISDTILSVIILSTSQKAEFGAFYFLTQIFFFFF